MVSALASTPQCRKLKYGLSFAPPGSKKWDGKIYLFQPERQKIILALPVTM
jgi:hypothetical protein